MSRQLPVIPESPLPLLYAVWIDQLLAGPIPRETDATCDNCAMLPDEGQTYSAPDTFFNPKTKCCTYVPRIPNYLVGNILADIDPASAKGRATVEARVRIGVGVTPLGLDTTPAFNLIYGQSSQSLFGLSETLLCPHYLADEGGRCGVWRHRASICATWHCKYVRGAVGHSFWSVLHQLLSEVERTLSRWSVVQLDIGTDALRHLVPPSSPTGNGARIDPRALDGVANPNELRKLWGSWVGREFEFYSESARIVNELNWQEISAIGSPDLQIYERLLLDAYSRLVSDGIPERLKLGPIKVIEMDRDSCQIVSYNRLDPLSIPRKLLDVFHYFDGRPFAEALEAISVREGLTLDLRFLKALTDFSILVPVNDDTQPSVED